ncbi:MAG: hypothetical protein HPY71_15435 [Firmicutes bacterium]|nr:hypothetical protein [Bacillota bacterium]
MSDERIEISIPNDQDGFISFQCPFCKQYFKLLSDEVQADDVFELFCPYCGLTAESGEFLTDDIKEQVMKLAKNRLSELINKLGDDMEKIFRNSQYITFKKGKKLETGESQPIAEIIGLDVISLVCCHRKVKVAGRDLASGIFCPYCGVK